MTASAASNNAVRLGWLLGDPPYQTTTGVDGIRFLDAFGPIVVALIVAGVVTLAILEIAAWARLVAPFAGGSMRYGTGTGPRDW